MTAPFYLDSSVIVSYLLPKDRNHTRSKEWLNAMDFPLATSVLTEVEVGRALTSFGNPQEAREAEKWMHHSVYVIDISDEIRRNAVDVRPSSLRSLDAIHVATAIWAGAEEFVSFDDRQSLAAQEMGLRLAKI